MNGAIHISRVSNIESIDDGYTDDINACINELENEFTVVTEMYNAYKQFISLVDNSVPTNSYASFVISNKLYANTFKGCEIQFDLEPSMKQVSFTIQCGASYYVIRSEPGQYIISVLMNITRYTNTLNISGMVCSTQSTKTFKYMPSLTNDDTSAITCFLQNKIDEQMSILDKNAFSKLNLTLSITSGKTLYK